MYVPLQILAFYSPTKTQNTGNTGSGISSGWAGSRLVLFLAAVNIVVRIKVGGAGNSWKIGYGFNLASFLSPLSHWSLEVLLWTR
jgi:hypothetical protein